MPVFEERRVPMAKKSLGEAVKKTAKCGVHRNEQKVCDASVPVKSGWKLTGFGNKGDNLNDLPPSKHLVV